MMRRYLNKSCDYLKDYSPIIIIGMHRSGTTMLARIFNTIGITMGKELSGNSESLFFQNLNREILKKYGGRWDDIAPVIEKMHSTEVVDKEAERINAILFGRKAIMDVFPIRHKFLLADGLRPGLWGWKDPRNSITLPIWLRIFPNARVIHVIRNGIDVAISLYRRETIRGKAHPDYSNHAQDFKYCFRLWELYVQACWEELKKVSTKDYMEIHYEDILKTPGEKVKSILAFLGKEINAKEFDKVIHTINPGRLDNSLYRERYGAEIKELSPSSIMLQLGYR